MRRGHKAAHSRAGHKAKNKRTFRGRFAPLEDPAAVVPRLKKPKLTEWKNSIGEVFEAGHGRARQGQARQGKARRGKAGQGAARQGD